MKKYLINFSITLGLLLALPASASLWEFYLTRELPFPSIEQRAVDYMLVGGDYYKGSTEQNDKLEEFLRGEEGTLSASTLPIAGHNYILSGSGITASATSITLQSLTIPQTGYELLDADFSTTFYITLEPGNTKRQEIVSCTTVTQNANNTATLSGCSRGLLPFSPFTASTTYQFSHAGGTTVIFSDPPQLFNEFTSKYNNETVTGTWTFNSFPGVSSTSAQALNNNEFVTLYQLQQATSTGGVEASETVKGTSELSTGAEAFAGTSSGATGARLVLPASLATGTPSATISIPITSSTGKLDAGFGGSTSSLATLDANTLVVQNPANATTTRTDAKIPIQNSNKLPWLDTAPATNTFPVFTNSSWSNVSTTATSSYFRTNSTTAAYEFGAIGDSVSFSPTRVAGTTYQNTGTRTLMVVIVGYFDSAMDNEGQGSYEARMSSTSTPATVVSKAGIIDSNAGVNTDVQAYGTLTIIVPPNYYYRLVDTSANSGTATLQTWVEYSL